jgi:DNA-binding transcriptional ArsR family regulator
MVYGIQEVTATSDDEKVNIDDGNQIQKRVSANHRIRFRFEEKTKITFESNKPANVSIKCDAERIGDKDFEIEVESDHSFNITMKCKEEQYEKGLMKGNTVQVRNRVRHRYQEGFVADIESTEDMEAKLRIKENDDNRGGTWAYYDKDDDEWIAVETKSSNGYLECKTDHFSTWTILVPEVNINILIIVGIGVGAAILLGVVIILSKRDYFHYLKTRTTSIEKGAHRLTLDEVLENENRNKIIELILENHGIHFNELLRKTNLAAGNLVWHLDILETYKVIGKKRIGNFITYFPYYQKNPISNIDLKLSKSKLTLKILELIEKEPGVWGNLITKGFKVDHKTIHYHTKKLLDLGLINVKKEGKKKKFFPNLDSEYFLHRNNNNDS